MAAAAEGKQGVLAAEVAAVESTAAAAEPVVAAVVVEEVPADYVGVIVIVPAGMIAAVIEYTDVVAVVAAAAGSNRIAITDYILAHSAYIHVAHSLALLVVIHVVWHWLVFETEMKCSVSACFA